MNRLLVASANCTALLNKLRIVLAYALLSVSMGSANAQFALSGEFFLESTQSHQYADVNLDSDIYTSRFDMVVAPTDVGKQAELFLAAYHEGRWYQKDPSAWIPWDGNPASLTPYTSTTLGNSVSFHVIEDVSLAAGDYQVFVSYRAEEEGFTTSSTAIAFSIDSAKSDRLHPFKSDAAMAAYLKQGMQLGSSMVANQFALETFATAADSSAGAAVTRVSSTNLQVAGVDEADVVKTDGEHLYLLRPCGFENCVVTFRLDAVNGSAEEIGSYQPPTEINDSSAATNSLYLIEDGADGSDSLVTLSGSNGYVRWLDIWGWHSNDLEIEFLDAGDPAKLALSSRLVIDGNLISSRRIGDKLYVVTRYTPFLEGFIPHAADKEAQQSNTELLDSAPLTSMLPKVAVSGGDPRDLIESKDCYLATNNIDSNRNPGIITVTTIPLDSPESFESTCFLGSTETVYMTTDALYLATTQNQYQLMAADALLYDPEHQTAIHKFDLTGGGVTYSGSGEVRGHLGWSEDKRSFRMGAGGAGGEYLNVVTSIGSNWGGTSSTRLTVLKQDGDDLNTVDLIDGIGKPGEQLYAARFVDERAYLVTFRVIDPLYVIDLSNQDSPVIVGELEIEGYSDYLHPVGNNLLLGFGKDAVPDDGSSDFGFTRGAWYQGVKISLFDVANPATPTEINSLVFGKRGSESEILNDHHGIAFLPATDTRPFTFAIPIQVNETIPENKGFDPDSPSAWYGFTNKGLYTFAADANGVRRTGYVEGDSSNALTELPSFSPFGDRSVLTDTTVFYVHQGEVKTATLPVAN